MKPAPFAYHAPDTLDAALELLAEHGEDAKPLAGGQSLIPVLNFRLARPSVLIDLNRIPELRGVGPNGGASVAGDDVRGGPLLRALDAARSLASGRVHDQVLRIGAMTRQREAERSGAIAAHAPLMAEALPHVAHPQIRNRGTVGGSVAHADPAAELPAVMLALNATLRLRGPAGERELAARDFFTGLFATALQPGELLAEIGVPALPAGAGCAFLEVARRHGDYALAAVAAVVVVDENGECREARVAYVNCGPGPLRSASAEAVLTGERIVERTRGGTRPVRAVLDAAADAATADLRPASDVHATSGYRAHLARVLTTRAVARAGERAMASTMA